MRTDLCRAHVEFAQSDGRIGGIESHEAIVQEVRGKAKPENEQSTVSRLSGVVYRPLVSYGHVRSHPVLSLSSIR
jgi:hypothetical protein